MKSYSLYLLLSYCCLVTTLVYAQSDSVRTEYKTEDEQISKSEIQRVIRYITRANIEEKTLIKLGGIPSGTPFSQTGNSSSIGLNTELSVERKVSPSFSILFGFDNQFSVASYKRVSPLYPTSNPEWRTDRSALFNSSAKLATRYYYNMAARIKRGKSANNFSGTYIAFQGRQSVFQYSDNRQYELSSRDIRHYTQQSPFSIRNPISLALQWGLQQRLGRYGYVDFNAGPEITMNNQISAFDVYNNLRYNTSLSPVQISLRVGVLVGLGW